MKTAHQRAIGTLRLLFFLSLAGVCGLAYSAEEASFRGMNDIVDTLNPLDVVANHGGIRRSIANGAVRIHFLFHGGGNTAVCCAQDEPNTKDESK